LPEFILFPLLHPAAALHQGNLLVPLREDFQKLKDVLQAMRSSTQPSGQDEPSPTEATSEQSQSTPPPTQMDLF
jgi:DNA polymerase